jgi:ribosomal-protein-alanine acetyltransferase
MLPISKCKINVYLGSNQSSNYSISSFIKLDREEFPFPWSEDQWLKQVKKEENHYLAGVEYESELIGFILFKLDHCDKSTHLYKIVLAKQFRKMGLGDYLLQDSISYLKSSGFKSIYLEVEESNHNAQQLYLNNHFQIIHRVEKYYSNGHGALMMQCEFD